jgi:hypothetical protein
LINDSYTSIIYNPEVSSKEVTGDHGTYNMGPQATHNPEVRKKGHVGLKARE